MVLAEVLQRQQMVERVGSVPGAEAVLAAVQVTALAGLLVVRVVLAALAALSWWSGKPWNT